LYLLPENFYPRAASRKVNVLQQKDEQQKDEQQKDEQKQAFKAAS